MHVFFIYFFAFFTYVFAHYYVLFVLGVRQMRTSCFVGNIPKSYTEEELRPVSCGCVV
jgi:hypothetical protein